MALDTSNLVRTWICRAAKHVMRLFNSVFIISICISMAFEWLIG